MKSRARSEVRVSAAINWGVQLSDAGAFSRAVEYFTAVANAAAGKLDPSIRLGALVSCDILDKTTLFGDIDTVEQFPLTHMDLGTQNIIVDDNFNFVAIIDWEFAQTAPWQDQTPRTFSEILAISRIGMCYGKTFLDESTARSSKRRRENLRRKAELLKGRLQQADRGHLREMVRLAFGLDADKVEEYLSELEQGGEIGGSG
ncbi:uncharacterized protein B0T15DRAFT_574621 [Chaetomium strumarium]|uniref:Aminoglycoside phosphotransferase domain-containing protein n=1 Tax=Chaetomium strumarium TaxID=1170767 RepID=A0AAJ0GSC8_9PEZI|nr:hypothetical protein B0T15DRAFT_574621 [Chaetomium strumarium]